MFKAKLLLTFVVLGSTASAWQDTSIRPPAPLPIGDDVSPTIRAARSNLYGPVLHSFESLLSKPSGAPPIVTKVHRSSLPELPVSGSCRGTRAEASQSGDLRRDAIAARRGRS